MSEELKDPKEGKEKPAENGQPAKPTDEKVEISKSELEKLEKKSKDFDGIVEANKNKNRIGRTIPGVEPVKEKVKPSDEDDDDKDDDDEFKEEFATKKDLQKHIDKLALTELQKDPFIDAHYDDLLEYVHFKEGERETIDGVVAAFKRAVKGWKSDNPDYKEPSPKVKDDEDIKSKSDLATDAGLSEGKDKKPLPIKKSIIPKKEKMENWYGDKK